MASWQELGQGQPPREAPQPLRPAVRDPPHGASSCAELAAFHARESALASRHFEGTLSAGDVVGAAEAAQLAVEHAELAARNYSSGVSWDRLGQALLAAATLEGDGALQLQQAVGAMRAARDWHRRDAAGHAMQAALPLLWVVFAVLGTAFLTWDALSLCGVAGMELSPLADVQVALFGALGLRVPGVAALVLAWHCACCIWTWHAGHGAFLALRALFCGSPSVLCAQAERRLEESERLGASSEQWLASASACLAPSGGRLTGAQKGTDTPRLSACGAAYVAVLRAGVMGGSTAEHSVALRALTTAAVVFDGSEVSPQTPVKRVGNVFQRVDDGAADLRELALPMLYFLAGERCRALGKHEGARMMYDECVERSSGGDCRALVALRLCLLRFEGVTGEHLLLLQQDPQSQKRALASVERWRSALQVMRRAGKPSAHQRRMQRRIEAVLAAKVPPAFVDSTAMQAETVSTLLRQVLVVAMVLLLAVFMAAVECALVAGRAGQHGCGKLSES